MDKGRPVYLAYLLRLWRVNDLKQGGEKDEDSWRASLEDPRTGRRVGFATLLELFVFIEEITQSLETGSRPPDGPGPM